MYIFFYRNVIHGACDCKLNDTFFYNNVKYFPSYTSFSLSFLRDMLRMCCITIH